MNKNKKNRTKKRSRKRKVQGWKFGNFRINRFQQTTKPATYGPGFYRFCVTKLISGSFQSQVHFLGYTDIMQDNPELGRIRNDFKYFKLENISVTFSARNYPIEDNQTPCYFLMNYDGYTTPNLRLQDNVKVIPAYLQKDKMYKYLIPDIHATTMLMSAWCTVSDFGNYDEIVLQFHAPDNTTSWYVRVDFNIICRGPTSSSAKEIKINEFQNKVIIRSEENKINKIKDVAEIKEVEGLALLEMSM